MAGLGELFVIRTAGNVVGEMEAASAIYACEHLHTHLLLVLGHTHCGAIKAAIEGEAGPLAPLTDPIRKAIDGIQDPYEACVRNMEASIAALCDQEALKRLVDDGTLDIRGALYHTHCGVVDFL